MKILTALVVTIIVLSVVLASVPMSKIHVTIANSNFVMIYIDGRIVNALLAADGETLTYSVIAGSHEVLVVVQADSPGSSWSWSKSVLVLPFSSETVKVDLRDILRE
jgi:Na+/citrate or Na+/malate symporter